MKKLDIEKLFRANQHKYSEQPSPEAWNRLEHRLDDHFGRRRSRRMKPQRPMAMAAALAILIVMVGIITMLTADKKSIFINQQASIHFEDIKTTDNAENVMEVVEFTRRHKERLARPIAEGDEDKKLQISQ
jgi:hypothetical protein